jgi:hypothetical protein
MNPIIKTYKMEDFLDSQDDVNFRINFINSINNNNNNNDLCVPKTNIRVSQSTVTYTQERIKIIPHSIYCKQDFKRLIPTLDYFQQNNFVHGDLNKKNIVYTQFGFKIVDLEPSLKQNKSGRPCLMVTRPYIHPLDIYNDKVSLLTDKVGFFFFILRCQNQITTETVSKLSFSQKNKSIFDCIPLKEKEFNLLSFEEILNISYKSEEGCFL